ncbi:phosphoesterase [Phenylobacterium hankyongense]|uniref:Phosphoesterase n=1 Tax=Phenylobacterium hankyongense TaxID=1813876 RepID=A0A328B0P6_9CAUL|nr:alkaline phosphatase family protein [Phenylobacterium hankyongense]RAK59434.1 phosphoesterase [Phenylobacterium hankyongense]
MTRHRLACALTAAAAVLAGGLGSTAAAADFEGVPRYDHVFVIVEENKDYSQILDPAVAPNIAALAARYGNATQFFGEVHPSEANYVALLGGDTFGIHDDDAYYCSAGSTRPSCGGAAAPGYADHTVRSPHLGDQLLAAGLSWKGYYESLPEPGSLAVIAGDPSYDDGDRPAALYASKHSGFMNFASVQNDPRRAERILGFDAFERDLATGALPNFALIVPNQCNEMHGLHGPHIPADCESANKTGLIGRGDKVVGDLVRRIQASPLWAAKGNVAIIVTFDEGAGKTREGCCAVTPDAPSNFGGGHIPTLVITNHGARGLSDDTAYNHYSLLRTLEDAFRLPKHLGHAADTDKGVRPMTRLFATAAH